MDEDVREWSGIKSSTGEEHGSFNEKLWSRWCASCGGYHGDSYVGCNGLRENVTTRCSNVLGEVRCDRPEGHLYEHMADSEVMRIGWMIK